MGEDRTPPERGARRRTTVAEAAEILGISAEAVRGRIRRGTLRVEREGRTVYVLLAADQSRTTSDQPTDRTDALINTLTQQIEDLREQVRSERQAHAEARRLLAAALERIPPAIEAPASERSEPPGDVETGSTVEESADRRPAGGEAQERREAAHGMHMPEAGGGPLPHDQQRPLERRWWEFWR